MVVLTTNTKTSTTKTSTPTTTDKINQPTNTTETSMTIAHVITMRIHNDNAKIHTNLIWKKLADSTIGEMCVRPILSSTKHGDLVTIPAKTNLT